MTAQATLHAIAGSPEVDGCAPTDGRCWVCSHEMTRGQLVGKWMGSNYTDQNKARCPDATHICEPCVWCMSWVQPPGFPPPDPGKKGLNLRLFSHLYDDRGYLALNKASKPAILKWLREPKQGQWFAAIADTGQKHVLPWTPVNPGQRGVVRFEERNIALPGEPGWALVDDIMRLLTDGVTKDEVGTGDYTPRAWKLTPAGVMQFESDHAGKRGTAWFDLALWLSQRDEEEYEARRQQARSAEKPSGKGRARDAKAVPRKRRKPARPLGSDQGADAHSDGNDDNRSGVGERRDERPEAAGPDQQSLNFDS